MNQFQPCPQCPNPEACAAMGQCAIEAEQAAAAAPVAMKKGGRVKKAEGGAVKKRSKPAKMRGVGIAKKGVRKPKMY